MPDDPKGKEQEQPGGLKGMLGHLREITYGMAAHDMTRSALRTRASMEHLFILMTMGDMLGRANPAAVLLAPAAALRRPPDLYLEATHAP